MPSDPDPRSDENPRLSRAVLWLGVMLVLSLALRMHSVVFEVIDWDESTFILTAAGFANGELPYGRFWDIKPPMLFTVLAGAMLLFGESLATVRALAAVCVALAGFLVYLALRPRYGDWPSGLAALLAVAVTPISHFLHLGTEHLAIVFLAGALLMLVQRPRTALQFAGLGVLVSLAALTRLNLGLLAVGLVLYLLWLWARGQGVRFRDILSYIAGGLIPPLMFAAVYAAEDMLRIFLVTNVTMPLAFAGDNQPFWRNAYDAVRLTLSLGWQKPHGWGIGLVLAGTGAVLLWRQRGAAPPAPFATGIVFAGFAGLTALSLPLSGQVYLHHLLQLFPALIWLIAAALASVRTPRGRRLAYGAAGLAVVAMTVDFLPRLVPILARQEPPTLPIAALADQIEAASAGTPSVLAIEDHLIYWYLGIAPPLPLGTHPSNLVHSFVAVPKVTLGLAPERPFEAALETQPEFIVMRTDMPGYLRDRAEEALLLATLEMSYAPWQSAGRTVVYRRVAAE